MTTRSGSGTISFVDAAPGATIGHSNSIGGGSGGVVGGGAYSSDAGTIYTSGYFETSSYYQTTWENPIAISTLSKYLSSIPANDSKKIVSLLEDNARSLEDHLDTAYLKTSGGTVYGPTTLAGDINLIGTVSVETRPLISLLPPPGSITLFGGTSLPGGWLPCDGTAVSRTDYATLWSVIGGNFGAGNGSTTFNLPNLASKFPLGSTGTPGATGGSATIATGNLPTHTHGHNHTHDFDISQADAHNHFYTISSAYQAGTNRNGLSGIATATRVGTSVIENANLSGVKPTRGADGDETDNGGFANSAYYPPYVTVRYIIKT